MADGESDETISLNEHEPLSVLLRGPDGAPTDSANGTPGQPDGTAGWTP